MKKITAIFLSFSLSFYNVLAYAQPAPATPARTRSAATVPASFGMVEESFQGKTDKTIFYIQDAHDSLEAQENIAKLIRYYVERYNVKTVFEEGYEGPVPTDEIFSALPDSKTRQQVSYFLMDHLRLGGAEYAHINRHSAKSIAQSKSERYALSSLRSAGDFDLIGVDSLALHFKHVENYRKLNVHKTQIGGDLELMKKPLERLANQVLPKQAKEWLKLEERLENKKIQFPDYLARLRDLWKRQASASEVFEDDYPVLGSLLKKSAAFSESRIPRPKQMFQELKSLGETLEKREFVTTRDLEIFRSLRAIKYLQKLIRFEMSFDEFEVLRDELISFRTGPLAKLIASETHSTLVLSKNWEEMIHPALEFYQLTESRDQVIEKSMKSFFHAKDQKSAVLVFGGFHASRIKAMLKEKNISYVVITPHIRSISPKHQLRYRNLMGGRHYAFESVARVLARSDRATSFFASYLQLSEARAEVRALSLWLFLAARWNLRRFDNLYGGDPHMVFIKDPDSRFVYANPAFLNFIGKNKLSEIFGKNDHELKFQHAEKYMQDDRRVVETLKPVIAEELNQNAQGEARVLRVRKVPHKNIFGEVTGVRGYAEDITEQEVLREKLEKTLANLQHSYTEVEKTNRELQISLSVDESQVAELKKVNEELRVLKEQLERNVTELERRGQELTGMKVFELLSGVMVDAAHHIRNPLMGAMGKIELQMEKLQVEPALDEGQTLVLREELGKATLELNRIKNITEELFTLSKLAQVPVEVLNLSDVVERAYQRTLKELSEKVPVSSEIKWERRYPKEWEKLFISGNSAMLEKALSGMMSNAYQAVQTRLDEKAIKEGGIHIQVGVSDHGQPEMSIQDNGPGIAEGDKRHIFEPFYSKQKNHGSLGLGLFVSKAIITKYGGLIAVDSKPGEETKFKLVFKSTTENAAGLQKQMDDLEEPMKISGLIFHDINNQFAPLIATPELMRDQAYLPAAFQLLERLISEVNQRRQFAYDHWTWVRGNPTLSGLQEVIQKNSDFFRLLGQEVNRIETLIRSFPESYPDKGDLARMSGAVSKILGIIRQVETLTPFIQLKPELPARQIPSAPLGATSRTLTSGMPQEKDLSKLKYLIVEDEPNISELLQTVLAAKLKVPKNNIAIVTTAEAAIEIFDDNPDAFDLIFMDVNLAGEKNGIEAARAIRNLQSRVKIIIQSGHLQGVTAPENLFAEGLIETPADVLQKPFELKALITLVKEVMNRSEARGRSELQMGHTSIFHSILDYQKPLANKSVVVMDASDVAAMTLLQVETEIEKMAAYYKNVHYEITGNSSLISEKTRICLEALGSERLRFRNLSLPQIKNEFGRSVKLIRLIKGEVPKNASKEMLTFLYHGEEMGLAAFALLQSQGDASRFQGRVWDAGSLSAFGFEIAQRFVESLVIGRSA